MGTRADFYVGRGESAEWIGSIALDGYPTGVARPVLASASEKQFRFDVAELLRNCTHGTTPDQGWPWPWNDSRTTDYAYAFDDGQVFASAFGRKWFPVAAGEPGEDSDYWASGKVAVFPKLGGGVASAAPGSTRSGLIVV